MPRASEEAMERGRVEFFFDYGSPYSYLADRVLPELARRTGAEIAYRPMLLGAVFQATGNRSPMQEPVEAKRRYAGAALVRTARFLGAPFSLNPHFPINTLRLMRTAVAAQQRGVFAPLHAAVYPAFWAEGLDLGDEGEIAAVLEKAGLDAAGLLEAAGSPEAKAALRANTDEAVARGAFGAPSLFLGDELFFGVDHLPQLERALTSARKERP
jgi:2-hydroxychromene-2-carboxylate isomerase